MISNLGYPVTFVKRGCGDTTAPRILSTWLSYILLSTGLDLQICGKKNKIGPFASRGLDFAPGPLHFERQMSAVLRLPAIDRQILLQGRAPMLAKIKSSLIIVHRSMSDNNQTVVTSQVGSCDLAK
jgi:hypothetical protein